MEAAQHLGKPPSAVVLGAEGPLKELVSELLSDAGACLWHDGEANPALVILVPSRPWRLAEEISAVSARHVTGKVLVLLPLRDEWWRTVAMTAGAWACTSLWESIETVREVFVQAIREERRP
jgi:hypothetical protein